MMRRVNQRFFSPKARVFGQKFMHKASATPWWWNHFGNAAEAIVHMYSKESERPRQLTERGNNTRTGVFKTFEEAGLSGKCPAEMSVNIIAV